MPPATNPSKNAWLQLYEARRVPSEPQVRTPGRPPSTVPRKKVGLTLSQGEISEIESWQSILSNHIGRKVSAGEAVGILVRICSSRYAKLEGVKEIENLAALVDYLVG